MSEPFYVVHDDVVAKNIRYGYFTNKGGHSQNEFSSLNFGFNVEDDVNHVCQNWSTALEFLQSKKHHILNLDHGDEILFLNNNSATLNYKMKAGDVEFAKHDACFTNQKNITLMTTSADCLNILFINEKSSFIGACHSGWQGTFKGINDRCAKYMLSLDARQENWDIIVGPCAFWEGYEVEEVFFKNFIKKNPENEVFFKKSGEKYLYDNKGTALKEYKDNGFRNIHDLNINTMTSSDFYSHRKAIKNNTKTGRFCSFVELI